MIRVLVADDHAVVRRGLLQILDEVPALIVAGQAASGREVLQAVQREDYDLLVLDIAMPDGSGLEVLRQLESLKPDLPVLILSMYSEKQYALRALRAGAAGYLTKESVPDELVAAIQKVASGGRYVSQLLAETLVAAWGGQLEGEPHESLSDRELEVFRLIGEGLSTAQLAQRLHLSRHTIDTHRQRIKEKLNLANAAELTQTATCWVLRGELDNASSGEHNSQ